MNVFSQSPNGAEGGDYRAVTLAFACGAGGGNGKHEGDLPQEYCRCDGTGGRSVCSADCHIYAVDRFPKKSGMARFYLSAFKSAKVIPLWDGLRESKVNLLMAHRHSRQVKAVMPDSMGDFRLRLSRLM